LSDERDVDQKRPGLTRYRYALLIGVFICFPPSLPLAHAQNDRAPSTSQARQLLHAAIEALGGETFLALKTIVGKGMYSQFDENGNLEFLAKFVDYIVYPDKERTEFGKGKNRFIQTNIGTTGWIYDGQQKAIRDQTPEQVENFQRGFRHSLDNILRRWHQSKPPLRYLGEREIWFRQRGQGVEIRFTLPDGSEDVVEVYIDPQTHLPLSVAYGNEEDRFFLYQDIDGIRWPFRIDHYRNGVQTSRIAYSSVVFNRAVDPRLFEKPTNPKKVK